MKMSEPRYAPPYKQHAKRIRFVWKPGYNFPITCIVCGDYHLHLIVERKLAYSSVNRTASRVNLFSK